jgi:hypothetical protein
MTEQEMEERDYEMGCASDAQNALAQSRMEFTDDTSKIKELAAQGNYVVVIEGPAYCGVTDAIIGTRRMYAFHSPNQKTAMDNASEYNADCDPETFAVVYFKGFDPDGPLVQMRNPDAEPVTPPEAPKLLPLSGDDDIPF